MNWLPWRWALLVAAYAGAASSPLRAQSLDVAIDANVTPRYTVGKVDSGDWEMFGSINAVAFDAGGRLFILDAGNRRIAQVGSDGKLVRSIGRIGRGPGEFSRPVGLAVTKDQHLVVFDAGQSAFSVFDTAGRFIRTFRPPFGRWYPGQRLRAHPDGGVISVSGDGQALLNPGEGMPTGYQLNRYALEAAEPVEVARAWRPGDAGRDLPARTQAAQRVGVAAVAAFSPRVYFDALADGRIAVADTTTYSVNLWSGGRTAGRLTRPIPPRRTTEADRREEVERRRNRSPERSGGISLVPQGTPEQMLRSLVSWPERSVITGLRTAPEGTLWIGRFSDEETVPVDIWRDDTYVGTIRHALLGAPDALGPGGLVAMIDEGDSGEPVVRVISVSMPPVRR